MNSMKRGSHSLRLTVVAVASMLEIAIMALTPAIVFAQQATSTNYSVNEAFFGTGGQLCDPGVAGNSTNYCAKTSSGELGVGNTSSTSYQARGGFNTDREPYLELIVNNASCPGSGSTTIDLSYLSASSAATTSANFSVKSYLTSGYIVQSVGAPPTSSGPSPHVMTAPSSPTASAIGTEQFGMNLKANTSPATFGVDPSQVPSGFGFGAAATGYNTTNVYKYVSGDTIASSTQSSGTTCFDMAYIFNISNLTPAGRYTFNQSVVTTSTF